MIYFRVPSDLVVINRLIEVLKLSPNEYTYRSVEGTLIVNCHQSVSIKVLELSKQLLHEAKLYGKQVQNSIKYVNSQSISLAEAQLKHAYKDVIVSKIEIDKFEQQVSVFGLVGSSVDIQVAKILKEHRFIPNQQEEDLVQDLLDTIGISKEELDEATKAISDVFKDFSNDFTKKKK